MIAKLPVEVGMSISVMVNFLGLGLLVLFVPSLSDAFGDVASNCKTNSTGCQDASRTGQARLLGMFAYGVLHVLASARHELTEIPAD